MSSPAPSLYSQVLEARSNSLRQNVGVYATYIDGFGHCFEPAIDFDADDVDEQIANYIYLERLAREEEEGNPTELLSQEPPRASSFCPSPVKFERRGAEAVAKRTLDVAEHRGASFGVRRDYGSLVFEGVQNCSVLHLSE